MFSYSLYHAITNIKEIVKIQEFCKTVLLTLKSSYARVLGQDGGVDKRCA